MGLDGKIGMVTPGSCGRMGDPTPGNKYIPDKTWDPLADFNPITDYQKWKSAKESGKVAKDNIEDTKKNLPAIKKALINWERLMIVLAAAGFTGEVLKWAAATAMFETGNLSSPPVKYHNWSNIAYTKNSPFQSGKGYKDWAAYTGPEKWARDFKRVLSLSNVHTSRGNGGPAAIDATSLEDYVNRLKANGYFGSGNAGLYLQGLRVILAAHAGVKQNLIDYEKAKLKNSKIPWWGWGLIGLGGIVVFKKIIE